MPSTDLTTSTESPVSSFVGQYLTGFTGLWSLLPSPDRISELRGALNSGQSIGTFLVQMAGDQYQLRMLSTWGAKASLPPSSEGELQASAGEATPSLYYAWGRPVQGGRVLHSIAYWPDETASTGVLHSSTEVRIRIMCHMLLDLLPAQGLEEAWESLTSISEYHRIQLAPPLQALPTERVKAKNGKIYERPEFQISED